MKHPLTSLQEAEDFLLQYSPPKMSGDTYTLDRMRELMKRLGDPQDKLNVIHIAGTSGKTSTAYFIRALLEQAGEKTGLTVSPHVEKITERVQVGGKSLADEVFLDYLNEFLQQIEEWHDLKLTYFELLIAFAYWVFAKEKVDYAVMETGLGGLLDATNVVARQDKVCVLTPIGLDHTNVLGNTITEIATQKAGIIQPGNVVFSAEQTPEATKVFQETCRRQSALLQFISGESGKEKLRLPEFQYQNLSVARAAFGYVQRRDSLSELTPVQDEAAARSMPPGRFEKYQIGTTTVILDGAHNPQKLEALIDSLPSAASEALWLVAIAEAPDQKLDDSLKVLGSAAKYIIWTDFKVGQDLKARRSFESGEVAKKARRYEIHSDVQTDARTALEYALEQKPKYLIIAGSLFLVALLRPELLRLAKQPSYQPPAK